FFFSSRRRHTRCLSDWSSDVCSSDLWQPNFSKKIKISEEDAIVETTRILRESTRLRMIAEVPLGAFLSGGVDSSTVVALMAQERSEERRVGKECRSRGWQYHRR